MYVKRNSEACSCNHCCSDKQEVLHILSVCVFVALGIQQALRMRHFVICGLPGSKISFHIIP